MRVTYVVQSFLDYRIPVFKALDQLTEGQLTVVCAADGVYVSKHVWEELKKVLGSRAIQLSGEKRVGKQVPDEDFANTSVKLVYQPGILKAIKATKPDVIVGDGFYQWTSFALLYRLVHRTPLVVTYERTFHTERNVQMARKLYRQFAMRFVSAMAVNGRLSREYSEHLGMRTELITEGQMAADTMGLSNAASRVSNTGVEELRRSWGGAEVVYLVVGRLVPRKGVLELLRAWLSLIDESSVKCSLVFVGTGSQEQELKAIAETDGNGTVFIEGRVEYNRIASYYAAADILVVPTLEDNWSLVVPEGMACGLPILCSIHNGCYPELVDNDLNGWLFDPLDPRATVESLHVAAANRHRLRSMGEISRKIVSDYSPEKAGDAIFEACEIALKSG